MGIGKFMKIFILLLFVPLISFYGCMSNNPHINSASTTFGIGPFSIPAGAELLESTEFKSDGVPYLIERRYRLPYGEIFFAYWDVDGSHIPLLQPENTNVLIAKRAIIITNSDRFFIF